MKKILFLSFYLLFWQQCFCWGFYAHRKINYFAVYLLPPEMMVLYKSQIDFLAEHAVDPDKRRYAVPEEGARHYIDIDHYGTYPFNTLPRNWDKAVSLYSADTLNAYGIVPWWLQTMLFRLTNAFKEKDQVNILKFSAEIGHYMADAHVPLHVSSNHDGQLTDQKGIHGFWESRIPELFAENNSNGNGWDFFIGKAAYISNPAAFIWERVLESAAASDTVLRYEKELSKKFPGDQKYSFEDRNGIIVRQYSTAFSKEYDQMLKGMIERRMRQSIFAVASFWYTAWVNAGQPNLKSLNNKAFTKEDLDAFEQLNNSWQHSAIKGREHDRPLP